MYSDKLDFCGHFPISSAKSHTLLWVTYSVLFLAREVGYIFPSSYLAPMVLRKRVYALRELRGRPYSHPCSKWTRKYIHVFSPLVVQRFQVPSRSSVVRRENISDLSSPIRCELSPLNSHSVNTWPDIYAVQTLRTRYTVYMAHFFHSVNTWDGMCLWANLEPLLASTKSTARKHLGPALRNARFIEHFSRILVRRGS